MKTVEVVIRINKNTFDAINELSKFVDDNHIINGYQIKGHSTVGSMITALANGTVLPKGHGKLVDADILLETLKEHRHSDEFCIEHNIDYAINLGMVGILIGDAPTVIEADREAIEK